MVVPDVYSYVYVEAVSRQVKAVPELPVHMAAEVYVSIAEVACAALVICWVVRQRDIRVPARQVDSHRLTQRLDSVVDVMVSTYVDELSLHAFERFSRLDS